MHYRICWRRLQKIEFRLRLYRKGSCHTVGENLSGMEFADSAFTLPNQSSRKLLQEPRWWARPLVLYYRSIQAMGNLQHFRLWYQTFFFFLKKITWTYHICGIGKKKYVISEIQQSSWNFEIIHTSRKNIIRTSGVITSCPCPI